MFVSSGLRSGGSGVRHRGAQAGPVIPLVACPDCGLKVNCLTSSTKEHTGWIFYRCKNHGASCDFWHWEREYVYYLSEKNVPRGDEEVEAVGWAEERREDLERELGKKFAELWGVGGGASSSNNNGAREDATLRRIVMELVVQGRGQLVLMKIAIVVMCFLALLTTVVILKK